MLIGKDSVQPIWTSLYKFTNLVPHSKRCNTSPWNQAKHTFYFLSNETLFSEHVSILSLPGQHATDLVLAERNRASLCESHINWLQTDGCVFAKRSPPKEPVQVFSHLPQACLASPTITPPPYSFPPQSSSTGPPVVSLSIWAWCQRPHKPVWVNEPQTLQPALLICTDMQGGVAGNSKGQEKGAKP